MGRHGLFRATDQVYSVRGFDTANISFIRGKQGWIVVDPLMSIEAARAAYSGQPETGHPPGHALIYTHQHSDQTGGVRGMKGRHCARRARHRPARFRSGKCSLRDGGRPYRSLSVRWRSYSLSGRLFGRLVGNLLSRGTQQMLAPTKELKDGEKLDIDGVRFVFQRTMNNDAPAEMATYFA